MSDKWCRDELILALDFYQQKYPDIPRRDTDDISRLAVSISEAGKRSHKPQRNRNSVYMKLMNFSSLDERRTVDGKRGLTNLGKEDREVWGGYLNQGDRLRQEAAAIVAAAPLLLNPPPEGDEEQDDDGEAEGGVLYYLHKKKERARGLAKRKRDDVLARTGTLACEACDFNFFHVYGPRGEGYIHVHHKTPLFLLEPGARTRLRDLAVVCANCHCMIHRTRDPMAVEDLRAELGRLPRNG